MKRLVRMLPRMRSVPLLTLAVLGSLAACDLPRDPGGTADRVKAGVLRAGLIAAPESADEAGGRIAREDRALVERIARDLNVTIEWRHAAAEALYAALERREIDLVAGGVPGKTPWSHRIGLTKPVGSFPAPDMDDRRLAVPPGENRWLLTLNRLIARFQQGGAR